MPSSEWFTSVFGEWMLLRREFIVAGDSRHITAQHRTTSEFSLGVLAGLSVRHGNVWWHQQLICKGNVCLKTPRTRLPMATSDNTNYPSAKWHHTNKTPDSLVRWEWMWILTKLVMLMPKMTSVLFQRLLLTQETKGSTIYISNWNLHCSTAGNVGIASQDLAGWTTRAKLLQRHFHEEVEKADEVLSRSSVWLSPCEARRMGMTRSSMLGITKTRCNSLQGQSAKKDTKTFIFNM